MALPVVAIVGRPNVGKSSLFNAVMRRRVSIVDPTAGVTRDRVSHVCDIDDVYLELVDTGGHGIVDRDDLGDHVERQIRYAVAQADLILFVVDARDGLNPLDTATAELLRPRAAIVCLIANKVDDPRGARDLSDFYKLGFGDPLPVSALHGHGQRDMLDMVADRIRDVAADTPADPVMKVALVGKRNAGKSTFVNALARQDRVIVSEIPGTTRDSIDVRFQMGDRTLVAIDTAGVRKKRKIADDVEFYAHTRATESIRRADVVLFITDATEPVSQVDKHLARTIAAHFKPCVIVVNKWDLAKGRAGTEDYGAYLTKVVPELDYAPISFTSANTRRNVESTIDVAGSLFKQARTRVGTGAINQILQDAVTQNLPRAKRGSKTPKFLYATQVAVQPPTIVLFVSHASAVTPQYERFLINRFRERLPFEEVPMRLLFRARRRNTHAPTLDTEPRMATPRSAAPPRVKRERRRPT
ncbi:MAG: ribosome biogenesis GTPase Der [Phycisphaerae bacterium]